jgi:hypothetical protein
MIKLLQEIQRRIIDELFGDAFEIVAEGEFQGGLVQGHALELCRLE